MSSSPDMHIGAIFIAYNAEKTLQKFYENFPKNLVQTIILVDDASQDGTYELALKLGIQSYKNPVNLGYGGNMKRAVGLALDLGMDVVIDIHPDGEYDPSAIPDAIAAVRKGADFVLGNRFSHWTDQLKSGMRLWKILPIVFLNLFAKFALQTEINDLHQGFRVYTRRLLNSMDYKANSDGYLFSFELIAQAVFAHMKVVEVPVKTHYVGAKRGASLKNSITYSFGIFKVLFYYFAAKIGLPSRLFPRHRLGVTMKKNGVH